MNEFHDFESVYTQTQHDEIKNEFKRIKDEHFLDHTGGTLYSEIQIENIFKDLNSSLFCNPHGGNLSSQSTEDAIDVIRFRILEHFHTNSEEYSVIFTSNATAALKIVAENFKSRESHCIFSYLEDNHTSVLGMRSYFKEIQPVKIEEAFDLLSLKIEENIKFSNDEDVNLFVYPAQSNFSGTKYPLEWIERIQNGGLNKKFTEKSEKWLVVLDAASYASTNDLNLSLFKPDFVPISFYKIFGYPTGVGVLLIRNSSQNVLLKNFYGGGTVSMAMAHENVAVFRNLVNERFEDGTVPFLSILALKHGFDTFSRLKISMDLISEHTFKLASYVYKNLIKMHHSNGNPAVILYHDTIFNNKSHQGGIVNFNLLRENGENIGYSEVMNMANLHKIHLRTGCSCNPGACQRHLNLTTEDLKKHFKAGHICGDQNDLIDGVPTGSVRISFGYMSTKEDADALLNMIENCFIKKPVLRKIPLNSKKIREKYENLFLDNQLLKTNENEIHTNINSCYRISSLKKDVNVKSIKCGTLKHLLLYPIKSCGAFVPTNSWKLSTTGLEFDRKWMIVNKSGTCMTQKHITNLCLIKPFLDVQNNRLKLTFPDEDNISLPLNDPTRKTFRRCESKICRDKVIGFDCGDSVSYWLNKLFGIHGLRLIEQIENCESNRINKQGEHLNLSFANQAEFLLVNLASVLWLKMKVRENDEKYDENIESILLRFRPNIVVDFEEPFIENEIESLKINDLIFKAVGNCTRCQMICINQVNAQKTKEPLITLGREFQGRVQFGVYFRCENYNESFCSLEIGSDINVTFKNKK